MSTLAPAKPRRIASHRFQPRAHRKEDALDEGDGEGARVREERGARRRRHRLRRVLQEEGERVGKTKEPEPARAQDRGVELAQERDDRQRHGCRDGEAQEHEETGTHVGEADVVDAEAGTPEHGRRDGSADAHRRPSLHVSAARWTSASTWSRRGR